LVRMSPSMRYKLPCCPRELQAPWLQSSSAPVCVKSAMFDDPCRDFSRLNRNWRELIHDLTGIWNGRRGEEG
jgi:hypothetical protein